MTVNSNVESAYSKKLLNYIVSWTICDIFYKIMHAQGGNVKEVVLGTFEKFMDWRQCAVVMQREA